MLTHTLSISVRLWIKMKTSLKMLSLSLIFSLNAATEFSSATEIDEATRENRRPAKLSKLFPSLCNSGEEITQIDKVL